MFYINPVIILLEHVARQLTKIDRMHIYYVLKHMIWNCWILSQYFVTSLHQFVFEKDKLKI